MLHYNMGVTYLESLKNPDEARQALERAAAIDPRQAEFHLTLGQVFQTQRLRHARRSWRFPRTSFSNRPVRARSRPMDSGARFCAAASKPGRVVRTPSSAIARCRRPRRPGRSRPTKETSRTSKPRSRRINASSSRTWTTAPRNCRRFLRRSIDLLTRSRGADAGARSRELSPATYYLPFFTELKARNYVEPFVYWAIQRAPVTGVREWITANQDRVREFVTWTRSYQWPKR